MSDRDEGIVPDDVSVHEIEEKRCEGCLQGWHTHYVQLDLRAIGQTQEVFRGCGACAEEIAGRLREGVAAVNAEDARS